MYKTTFWAVLPPFVPAPYVAMYVWHLLPLAGEHGRVKLSPFLFFSWCGGGGGVPVGGRGRTLARLCLRLADALLQKKTFEENSRCVCILISAAKPSGLRKAEVVVVVVRVGGRV